MLTNLKEILNYAERNNCAVGAFNVPNIASVLAVIKSAEKLNVPVILMHAQIHEKFVPLEIIGAAMIAAAKSSKVPVCVHLDHGEDLVYLKRALELGFTSIMYDGSMQDYDTNVEKTKEAVKLAKTYSVSVEGEIGVMAANISDESKAKAAIYTNPKQAVEFAEETGIDAIACSFGTVHGIYLSEPQLNFSIIEEIRKKIKIPIVMHGGSGVSKEQYRKSIQSGVRKINYFTYMSKAGGDKVVDTVLWKQNNEENKDNTLCYHELVCIAESAMEKNITEAMNIFYYK